jgi:tRNA(fMet)-specific endonuclease VapC
VAIYLLDTNIASFAIKNEPIHVRNRLSRFPITDVFISAITEAELRFGVARMNNNLQLSKSVDAFLNMMQIVSWTSESAKAYGTLRAHQERIGKTIGNMDLLIAAHALSINAVLVTNDAAFSQVKNLQIEDWTVEG